MSDSPAIALVQGDATGIGPELMAKLLATDGIQDSAQILIFSDAEVFQRGCEIAELETHLRCAAAAVDHSRLSPAAAKGVQA